MSDLTLVLAQQCVSNRSHSVDVPSDSSGGSYTVVTGDERTEPFCTCKWFKFNKPELCKHIKRVAAKLCRWHAMYSTEPQSEGDKEAMLCPACGGSTEWVQVAV